MIECFKVLNLQDRISMIVHFIYYIIIFRISICIIMTLHSTFDVVLALPAVLVLALHLPAVFLSSLPTVILLPVLLVDITPFLYLSYLKNSLPF